MEIGACDAEIELGGLPLTELSLDIGAASGRISFAERNPERLERMTVNAGAASVTISEIGNAGFESFDFDGGAGSFELDFRGGAYQGLSEVSIDVGLGSCEVILPVDMAVQVIADDDGWLSSVDFHNDDLTEVEDKTWQTEGFEDAETQLTLNIDVGMGSVDIYFK
jgi:hypothetical protein